MSLVPAKCTQCGGDIEVDNTHEAGICQYCGTPFITEKAINNYNITNNINIQNATINVQGVNIQKLKKLGDEIFEQFIDKYCDTFDGIGHDDCKRALGYFERVVEYEDDTEYKLKFDLCYRYIKNADSRVIGFSQRYSSESEKIIEKVKNFITKDDLDNNQGRSSEYAILFYFAHQSINFLFSEPRGNHEIQDCLKYFSLLLNFCDFMTKYSDEKGMHLIIRTFCRMHDLHLYRMITNNTLKLSKEDINTIKNLGNKIQDIYNKIGSSFTVTDAIINGRKQGCYIATCVYGSYDCPQVWTLRRYRDYTLDETWYGRLFIKCYYAISPKLIKWFGNYTWFRKPWKKFLDGMVERLNSEGVADTKYSDKYI